MTNATASGYLVSFPDPTSHEEKGLMTLGQKLGPIDDPRKNFHVPIRLQVGGHSHTNACKVHDIIVQSVMIHYITVSHGYATADSVCKHA